MQHAPFPLELVPQAFIRNIQNNFRVEGLAESGTCADATCAIPRRTCPPETMVERERERDSEREREREIQSERGIERFRERERERNREREIERFRAREREREREKRERERARERERQIECGTESGTCADATCAIPRRTCPLDFHQEYSKHVSRVWLRVAPVLMQHAPFPVELAPQKRWQRLVEV